MLDKEQKPIKITSENYLNPCIEDDDKGRIELCELLIDEIQNSTLQVFYTPDKYSKHDGWLSSGNCLNAIFEVKKRNVFYSSMLIEKKKYDHLISKCNSVFYKNKNVIPAYINIINGKCYLWNLMDFPKLKWEKRLLDESTIEKKYKEWKDVSFLPINKAIQIR